jgi:spore germination protein YaaH
MRKLIAVAWCLALAACTSTAEDAAGDPAGEPIPTVTTTVAPTTTTTAAPPNQTLRLSAAERLALHGDVTIRITDTAGEDLGEFHAGSGLLSDVAPVGSELRFTYHAPDGTPTDVTWTQVVSAGSGWDEVEQPWRRAGEAEQIVLAWQVGSNEPALLDQLTGAPQVNVASPIWWQITEDGSLQDRSSPSYAAAAAERGVALWPAIQSLDEGAVAAFVGRLGGPQAAAEDIADRAAGSGAAGVNVDVEGYRADEAETLVDFVAALTGLVHQWGGVVSVDLVPRSDEWVITPKEYEFWSTAPRRRELAAASDFVVVMAYDQHNPLRPAGPVADPEWVEEVLAYQLRYADPHRVILGVPMYGRLWNEADLESPRAVGIGAIAAAASAGEISTDATFSMPRVNLGDGRFTWLEDYTVFRVRAELAAEYGLSGWAAWRLGLDTPEAWNQLNPLLDG